jgi:hypothetical protein
MKQRSRIYYTETDHAQLDSFLAASMRGREFSWLQHEAGTIDESQWATDPAVLSVYMDSFLIRQCWKKLGRHYSGAGFVEFVDGLIAQIEPTNELWKAVTNWSQIDAPHEMREAVPGRACMRTRAR